jgi:hypothetical protein
LFIANDASEYSKYLYELENISLLLSKKRREYYFRGLEYYIDQKKRKEENMIKGKVDYEKVRGQEIVTKRPFSDKGDGQTFTLKSIFKGGLYMFIF